MPREPQNGYQDDPRRHVEWRDPRMDLRPRDEDVRIDRRDREPSDVDGRAFDKRAVDSRLVDKPIDGNAP